MHRTLSGISLVLLIFMCSNTAVTAEVPVSENLGYGAYSASGVYRDFDPRRAFDGDAKPGFYYWNSGDYSPQWVEVDLQQPYRLQRVNLVVAQLPDGETTHEVWISSEPIRENSEHATRVVTFEGVTRDRQWLMAWLTEPRTARYVQVRTTRSPSWVAWMEIQVYALIPR
jgi:hypothetical protein